MSDEHVKKECIKYANAIVLHLSHNDWDCATHCAVKLGRFLDIWCDQQIPEDGKNEKAEVVKIV
jgi:hypothetical protein